MTISLQANYLFSFSLYLYKHVINLYLTRILAFICLISYRSILTVGILIIILLILCNCFRM